MSISILPAKREDCLLLLNLMQGLAKFEGYIDDFRVTRETLETRGFPRTGEPEFYALLAELEGQTVGMLVYYFIPFTFDLRPSLFIKELYVEPNARNAGIGDALFKAVLRIARLKKCGRIKWDVLYNNDAAKRFYEHHGAHPDSKWQGYILELKPQRE